MTMRMLLWTAAAWMAACGTMGAQSPRFQRPDQAFQSASSFFEMEPLVAADVNGDGKVDLICRGGVWLNDGNARFRRHPVASPGFAAVGSGPSFAGAVVVADLDHDGDLDAIITWPASPQVILLNDGTGVFTQVNVPLPFPPPSPGSPCSWHMSSVVAGDLDGDGLTDLAGIRVLGSGPSCSSVATPFLWRSLGGLSFVDVTPPTLGPGSLTTIFDIYDEDGDGDGDLMVATGNNALALYRNQGGFNYVLTQTLLPPGGGIWCATRGDFDGDGQVDDWVVSSMSLFGTIFETVFIHGPAGFVAGSAVSRPCPSSALSLASLDVNGDGIDEVVRTLREGTDINTIVGGAVSSTPLQHLSRGASTTKTYTSRGALVADFDGDGDRDLAGIGENFEPQIWFANQTNKLVDPRPTTPATLGQVAPTLLCDFDGDGRMDLVGLRQDPCSPGLNVTASQGLGFGVFTDPPVFSPVQIGGFTGFASMGAVVAQVDFNGDGNLDLLIPVTTELPNPLIPIPLVLLGNGAGVFTPVNLPAAVWSPPDPNLVVMSYEDALVRDVNGDGAPDVLFLRAPSGGNASAAAPSTASVNLYLNMGGGAWSGPQQIGALHQAWEFAAGDFDLDGQSDDLVVASKGSGTFDPCYLVLNQNGTYLETPLLPAIQATSVAVGDLDLDGDLDLVFDGTPYLHQSGTTYIPGVPAVSPSTFYRPFQRSRLADLDGDGFLDLIVHDGWIKGLGNGGFGAYEAILPSAFSVSPVHSADPGYVPIDLDGDGDLDLVDGAGHIFWNMTRQLAPGLLPAPGRLASLDIFGPPNGPFALYASLGFASSPIPAGPWGSIYIDPASAVFVVASTLNSHGVASLVVPVPPNNALIGATVDWQAAFPSQVRLSGPLTTTVLRL